MDKLKTCPFCGGEGIVHEHIFKGYTSTYGVVCLDCCAETRQFYDTENEAIEAWNRRGMNNYKELIEALRYVDTSGMCPCEKEELCKEEDCIVFQAADAIEELTEQLRKERGKVSENNVVAIKVAEHGTNPM